MKALTHVRAVLVSRFAIRVSFLLLLGLASATPVFAEDWLGTTSTDWNNPSNWVPAQVPGAGDGAWINTEGRGVSDPVEAGTDTIDNLEIGSQGGAFSGAGNLTITSTGNLTVTDQLWVAVYTDLVNPSSWSTLNLAGTLTFATNTGNNFHIGWNGGNGQVLMSGNSVLNASGDTMYVGSGGAGAQGLLSMSGNSTANINQDMRFGYGDGIGGGCSGSLTMSGNATINRSGWNYVIFGEEAGNTGYFSMSGNSRFLSPDGPNYLTSIGHDGGQGTMTMADNSQYLGNEVIIGQNTGAGVLNVTGGTLTSTSANGNYLWEADFEVGRWGGTGSASFSGTSALNVYGRTYIGTEANGGAGASISNGSLTLAGSATMTTSGGQIRNYGWTWWDGGDVYVGCSEWENGDNATTQTLWGGSGSFTVQDYATANVNQLIVGTHGGTGTANFSGNAVVTVRSNFDIGDSATAGLGGAYGTCTMSGNAKVTEAGQFQVGTNGGTGTLVMSNNSSISKTGGEFYIGAYGNGNGTMTMNDNSSFSMTAGTDWFAIGAGGDGNDKGTLVMTGHSVFTMGQSSWTWIGMWGGTGTLDMSQNPSTNYSTFNVSNTSFRIGSSENGGTTDNSPYPAGLVKMDGHTTINVTNADTNVGIWLGAQGTITMAGSSTLNTINGVLNIGNYGAGTTSVTGYTRGYMTMTGNSVANIGWDVNIGNGNATASGAAKISTLTIGTAVGTDAPVMNVGYEFNVGLGGGSGSVVINSGTLTVGDWLSIGENPAQNAAGSAVFNSYGTLSMTGGVLNANNVLMIGRQGCRGVLTASNAIINVPNNPIFMAEVATGGQNAGTMTLNNCQLNTRGFQFGWATGTNANGKVYFNGSTVTCLQGGEFGTLAGGSGTTNVHFYVNPNGVTFNTNDYTVYTGLPLISGTASGGGVVKTGFGMLGLEGAQTFTGAVNIQQGTLFVGSGTTTASNIGASSGVIVQSGAIFSGSTVTTLGSQTKTANVMSGGMIEPSLPSGTAAKAMYVAAGTLSNGALLLDRIYSSASIDSVTGTGTWVCSTNTTIVDFDLTSAASVPTSTLKYLSIGTTSGTYTALPAVDTYLYGTTIYDCVLGTTSTGGTKTVKFVADAAGAVSKYWADTTGNWNTAGNWNTSGVPNGTGQMAIFGSAITAPQTVTLDTSPTVNSLIFQNSANSYTIAQSASNFITLGGSLSAYGEIDDYAGSHTINAPITMSKATRVTVTAGSSTLNIGGVLSGANGITLFGPGTLNLTGANTFAGPVVMEGGMGGTQTGLGTLEISSVANGGLASALGTSSNAASNLVLNGTLWYTGAAGTTNRGFTMAGQTIINTSTTGGGANSLTVTGQVVSNFVAYRDFVKTGAGSLTLNYAGTEVVNYGDTYIDNGTLAFAGASSVYNFNGITNQSAVNMFVGDIYTTVTPGVTTAALSISGGQVNVNTVYVGYQNTAGAQTGLTMSGGTLNTAQFYVGSYEDTSFNGAQQVNLSGTARVFASNFAEIGSSQGADSYLNMSGSATLETTYQLNVGMFGNATVVMSGNSTIKTDNNWVDIAPNTGACNFTMTGNSQFLTPAGLTFDIGTGNNTTAAFTGALGVFNVQQNALLEPGQLFVGRWNYGAGAVYQSGGSVISSGGNGNWVIGGTDGNTNPYGYYNLSAGTFNSGSSALCISDTGVGVWDQTGGNATVYQNVYVANQSTGMGVMNVNGGTFTTAATTSWGQGIFVGNAGSGVLNIGATGVVNTGAGDLWLTNSNGASSPAVGIANIGTTAQPGGHLVAEGIWSGGGQTAILNFHGGTVTATQNEGSFIGNLSHIFVYPEGATIDPAGNSIGLIQAFEAPTGVGIQSIAVASGGIGYIGTPVVTISGGSGQGATAVAVVSNGVITGFSITNPGSGYLPTDSLSVSVSGIGALAAGAAGAVTFNSGNNSGGLTLINSGTVAFCAPNTYTGNTVLQGPQVQLNSQVWNGSANVPAPAFAGNVVMNGSTYLVAEQPGQFGVNSALSFLQYGEFVLNGNSQTVAGLSDSSGKGIVENANSNLGAPAGNASTLTVYAGAGSSYYFNGLLRDNDNGTGGVLSLTKDGPGVLTLGGNSYGGNNTYSGVTTILNGTLALDATGTFPNSSLITIASGAVLDLTAKASSFNFGAGQTVGGYGTINIGSGKTVTFTGGGTLAPGGSIGTLNVVGNVDLTGGVAALELGTPGTSFASTGISDMTAITGNLTLGGTLNAIDNAGHNGQGSAGGGFYEIFTYTGSESGSFVASTGLIGTTLHGGAVNVPANKAVYLVVTNYGLPNTLTTPVNLGDIHPDGSFTPQNVGVTNVTAPGAFSESLEATSGSWDQILAPGASANLTVGISDTTPGPKNISVPVSFTSKAIPGTGMPDTVGAGSGVPGLQTQTVYVTGNVYGYAAPSVPASVPLGNIHPDGAFAPGSITVSNAAPTTGYYENLGCDAVSGPIVPGGSAGVPVGISDTSVGPKDVPVTLNFTSLPIVSDLSPTSLG
ncbi:MAG: autotransporter-associated beta strand repeat-containing protein, partial [Thermoguttaceae bacterium]